MPYTPETRDRFHYRTLILNPFGLITKTRPRFDAKMHAHLLQRQGRPLPRGPISTTICFKCETMIAFLSGILLEKHANTAILDVNGVGYEVSIPLSTFYELGEIGSATELRIYTHVREDAIQLFGFKSLAERGLYLKLISVPGIGPKLGIAMLSGMDSDEIRTAIRTNDLARLTSIPGVGRKTAERLVIELRDKVAETVDETGAAGAAVPPGRSGRAVLDDALSALINLGYQKSAAERALNTAAGEGVEISVQKLLRRSLQILAK